MEADKIEAGSMIDTIESPSPERAREITEK